MAALQDERSESRHTSRLHRTGTHRHVVTDREVEHDDEDREPPTDMLESFYSEGGRDSGSRRISWSIERHRNRAKSVGHAIRRPPGLNLFPTDTLSSPVTGASPSHEPQNVPEPPFETLTPTVGTARSSQATRKGSTLVFLGIWALFGFGTLSLQGPTYSGTSTKIGRVLSSIVHDVPSVPVAFENIIDHPQSLTTRSLDVPESTFINQSTTNQLLHDKLDSGERSSEQVIGRFFAWTCAILYFTSRLPQIWKNVSFGHNQGELKN
jgi:hypothetical protein